MTDFATTVVMAISDGLFTMTATIGDGAIVARRAEASTLDALSWPEHGDYAATTFFLTDAVPRLRIGVMHDLPIDRIAVLTDGLERLALDFRDRVAHRPFFDVMFSAVASCPEIGRNGALSRHLAAFLECEAVNKRTDDDKTLILAVFG